MELIHGLDSSMEKKKSVYLTGVFPAYSMPNLLYRVELSHAGLEIRVLTDSKDYSLIETISLKDIVGCFCLRYHSKYVNDSPGQEAFISICYYKLTDTKLRGYLRKRFRIILEVSHYVDFARNLSMARKWKHCILFLLRREYLGSPCSGLFDPRKILILINPKSGSGKALSLFENQVLPILRDSGIFYDYYITKKPYDAFHQMRKLDLSIWRGIVVASGDGLLFEVFNGLYSRDDWESCMSYPLGVIPCGSGNGLARSIAHVNNEPYTKQPIVVSTLNILSGKCVPMDLVHIETEDKKYCSFLSIGWGMLADIDIESERLRILGETRFTAYAVTKILNMKLYSGRLSYLPKAPVEKGKEFSEENLEFVKDEIEKLLASNDTFFDNVHTHPDKSIDFVDNLTVEKDYINCNETRRMSIPPLSSAVPNDWVVMEGDFIMVYAVVQTHIGTDAFFAPKARLDDGVIWLLIVTSQATRMEMAQFLLSIGDASHLNCPNALMVPVQAFRLEPTNKQGNLVVDGEVVRYGKIQAEIWPSKASIYCR